MPYYYGKWAGTGTKLDPFLPDGVIGTDWSTIDLRPDGGATLDGGGLNALLLHSDTPQTSPALIKIADTDTERLKSPVLRNVESFLGITVTSTNLRDLLVEVFSVPRQWQDVKRGSDGKRGINLGPTKVET